MKKAIALINPILVYTKYLLLAASLLLALVLVAQLFKLDIQLDGNLAETMIPFMLAASISMFFTKRVKIKKR